MRILDITSPVNLWKDYDVATLPLNSYPLSQKAEAGKTVKEYYFDGYTTVDGRVRAYIKIYENPAPKGVILYLPCREPELSDKIRDLLFDSGYTVAELDYLGKNDKNARYTIYPKSLVGCNSIGIKEFDIASDEKYTRWYIWTCIARRAALLLKGLYDDSKIFAVGAGLGGSTVYKLTAFDDGLTACATLLNILPTVKGEGNAIINYHASLDNYAYAPISKVPLFMAVSSNDEDGSIDEISALACVTESLVHFRIIERGFHSSIVTACPALDKFLQNAANGTVNKLRPQITASNSDGNLYYNITIDGDEQSEEDGEQSSGKTYKPSLYVSFCDTPSPYRSWMNIKTISLGNNKFMAQINVCQSDRPIYAFANITDDDGTVHSSPLLMVMPKSLGVTARAGIAHRKIYDGSMGTDCWATQNGGTIRLVQGPYGIDGVTSDTKNLVTFKPGDPLFKVPTDTLLQIMLAGKPQTVTIRVNDGENKYSCYVDIANAEDWHKFSLAHNNFKSDYGTLCNWSKILTLEFSSDEEFTIGSVLWV